MSTFSLELPQLRLPRSMALDSAVLESCVLEVPAAAHLAPSALRSASLVQKLVSPEAPIGLELWLTRSGPRCVVRVPIEDQLGVQAMIGQVAEAECGVAAPFDATGAPTWQLVGRLERPEYLPLAELSQSMDDRHGNDDPLRAFAAICPTLEPGEGVLYQMLIQPRSLGDRKKYELLTTREGQQRSLAVGAGQTFPRLLKGGLFLGIAICVAAGLLMPALLHGLVPGLGFGAGNLVWLLLAGAGLWTLQRYWSWFDSGDELVDPKLVKDKSDGFACDAELRVSVYGPRVHAIRSSIERALQSMQQRADGNNFVLVDGSFEVERLAFTTRPVWMNVDEIATYWHQFPGTTPRATFTWRAPQAGALPRRGFVMGYAGRPPRQDEVRGTLDWLLDTPMLVLGGRKSGKSNARRVWLQGILSDLASSDKDRSPAILNVDPLGGEAWCDFGAYSPELSDRLHILSTSLAVVDEEHCFTFNPFEVRTREEADLRLAALRAAWHYYFEAASSWGPRMEHLLHIVFKAAIYANLRLATEPSGYKPPAYGLLDALHMLYSPRYWHHVLEIAENPSSEDDFYKWFREADERTQFDIKSSLIQKLSEIEGNEDLRRIFGSTKSSFNLTDMLESGDVVTLHIPEGGRVKGILHGVLLATLCNGVLYALESRINQPIADRRGLLMLIDEAHMVPFDYAKGYAVTRQLGASQIMFSQSTSQFRSIDGLMDTVESNITGLVCMRVSSKLDQQFAGHWMEDVVSPSSFADTPPGHAYVRVSGSPPFSMRFNEVSSHEDPAAMAAARMILDRDIRAGMYRSVAEIDTEYEMKRHIWEGYEKVDKRSHSSGTGNYHTRRGNPPSGHADDSRAVALATATENSIAFDTPAPTIPLSQIDDGDESRSSADSDPVVNAAQEHTEGVRGEEG